jgi:hypothetical protein
VAPTSVQHRCTRRSAPFFVLLALRGGIALCTFSSVVALAAWTQSNAPPVERRPVAAGGRAAMVSEHDTGVAARAPPLHVVVVATNATVAVEAGESARPTLPAEATMEVVVVARDDYARVIQGLQEWALWLVPLGQAVHVIAMPPEP